MKKTWKNGGFLWKKEYICIRKRRILTKKIQRNVYEKKSDADGYGPADDPDNLRTMESRPGHAARPSPAVYQHRTINQE